MDSRFRGNDVTFERAERGISLGVFSKQASAAGSFDGQVTDRRYSAIIAGVDVQRRSLGPFAPVRLAKSQAYLRTRCVSSLPSWLA